MSGRAWFGGIYLRKGGYVIVLKALKHYQNRVAKIVNDPHVKETAMNLRMLFAEEGKKNRAKS